MNIIAVLQHIWRKVILQWQLQKIQTASDFYHPSTTESFAFLGNYHTKKYSSCSFPLAPLLQNQPKPFCFLFLLLPLLLLILPVGPLPPRLRLPLPSPLLPLPPPNLLLIQLTSARVQLHQPLQIFDCPVPLGKPRQRRPGPEHINIRRLVRTAVQRLISGMVQKSPGAALVQPIGAERRQHRQPLAQRVPLRTIHRPAVGIYRVDHIPRRLMFKAELPHPVLLQQTLDVPRRKRRGQIAEHRTVHQRFLPGHPGPGPAPRSPLIPAAAASSPEFSPSDQKATGSPAMPQNLSSASSLQTEIGRPSGQTSPRPAPPRSNRTSVPNSTSPHGYSGWGTTPPAHPDCRTDALFTLR